MLRQSSQAVSPSKLCEGGNKRILKRLVVWSLLLMGKGRIKRILRLCHFEFFDKGEGRHKRIQAVSPSFFWKREKRDTKRIQAVSPWRILFGKGRREWKRWIAQVFEQRTFLGRECFEQKLLERWREDETEQLLKEMKRMNSTSFQGLENKKTLESFWHKEEEEVQRDSRLVKDWLNKCSRFLKCKTKPCFYRLFMSRQDNHLEEL